MKLACTALLVLGLATSSVADELDVARAALRDGLWSVARSHAETLQSEEALLVILESYASEDRWVDVRETLKRVPAEATHPAFGYYKAVVEGRLDRAVEILRTEGSQAGLASAKMLEANLCLKDGKRAEAEKLWREVLAMTNVSERAEVVASVNLADVTAMSNAYRRTQSAALRQMVGLRLGIACLANPESEAYGAKLIRAIVQDCPDALGAREAYLSLARTEGRNRRWKQAYEAYTNAAEIWPEVSRFADVQEELGDVLSNLGRLADSLVCFERAEGLATNDAQRALAVHRQGDVLSDLGRGDESLARYRTVLEKYPETEPAHRLRRIVELREREANGRELYRAYRFEEAMKIFSELATDEPESRARMAYLQVLCQYGLGHDDKAKSEAESLAETSEDASVRASAVLWLAKFAYNQGDWSVAISRFTQYADLCPTRPEAPYALLWATRAAFASSNIADAIRLSTELSNRYPNSPTVSAALLVQAEALFVQARYDEAILVLERVTAPETESSLRTHAQILRADAIFAMGADNTARYQASLEAYQHIRFSATLEPDLKLSVSDKIGRVREKLKQPDKAIDEYYTEVVYAYWIGRQRGEHFGEGGRAAFVHAAFRLADLLTARSRDQQAIGILKLVIESGLPAAEEARKRIDRIEKKGSFL